MDYEKEDTRGVFYEESNINKAIEIISKVSAVLRQEKAKFFLDYGTLLGCVRNGIILPYDNDVDFGVFAETWHGGIVEKLREEQIGGKESPSILFKPSYSGAKVPSNLIGKTGLGGCRLNHVTCDLYLYPLMSNAKRVNIITGKWIPEEILSNFMDISFYGVTVPIPTKYEEYLSILYGKDWRIAYNPWTGKPSTLPFPIRTDL